jgi:hypothetical protein
MKRLFLFLILASASFGVTTYFITPITVTPVVAPVKLDSLHNVNYTIHADSEELEWEIARKLGYMERQIVDKWLDGPIPNGMRHITINIRISAWGNRAYCTMTDHPNIHIVSDRESLEETLMHELTHALLGIRYPDLPRWTHEGVASTWDGSGHQSMYLKILAWSRKSGTYPKLDDIMQGVRFNGANSTAYTASNSLVKFLLYKNDRYTLYLYATGKCTLERAYGFRDIPELQAAWVAWVNAPVEAKKPAGWNDPPPCPCCGPEDVKAPPSTPTPITE